VAQIERNSVTIFSSLGPWWAALPATGVVSISSILPHPYKPDLYTIKDPHKVGDTRLSRSGNEVMEIKHVCQSCGEVLAVHEHELPVCEGSCRQYAAVVWFVSELARRRFPPRCTHAYSLSYRIAIRSLPRRLNTVPRAWTSTRAMIAHHRRRRMFPAAAESIFRSDRTSSHFRRAHPW
jgi:hypothetical protein